MSDSRGSKTAPSVQSVIKKVKEDPLYAIRMAENRRAELVRKNPLIKSKLDSIVRLGQKGSSMTQKEESLGESTARVAISRLRQINLKSEPERSSKS